MTDSISENQPTRHRWLRVGMSAGAGAMLALAFPGIDVGVMLWLWLPLLLGALDVGGRGTGWSRFRTGWLAGFVFHLVTLRWLSDIWSAGPVLSLVGWSLLSAYLALYFGVWSALVGWLARVDWQLLSPQPKVRSSAAVDAPAVKATLENWSDRVAPLERKPLPDWVRGPIHVLGRASLAAVVWVALEWVRGWFLTGFGWNGLAVGMYQNSTLIQAADLIGVSGLSFLPVFCGFVLYVTLRRVHLEISNGRWRPHPDFGVAVMLVALCFLYGVSRLSEKSEVMPLSVAAVQPLMSQQDKHDGARSVDHAIEIVRMLQSETHARDEHMAREIEAAIADGREISIRSLATDLVVLPESVVPWVVHDRYSYEFADQLRLASGGPCDVVMGLTGQLIDQVDPKEYNSVAAFIDGQEMASEYHKMRLVPFGEYLPLRWFPPMEWIAGAAVPGDFDRGTSTDPLVMGGDDGSPSFDMIPLLCFEDTIGDHARQFIRPGRPQVLVNVTNDGWFAGQVAGRQHAANALFRCIELRRPMVRAANTGMTCVIDSSGSFHDRFSDDVTAPQILLDASGQTTQVRGVLFGTAYLPVSGEVTVYAAWGDWFAKLCAAVTLVAIVVGVVRGRRRKGSD